MAEIKKIGRFEGIFQSPKNGSKVTSLIILLHGWGADASDMFGLVPILGQIRAGCMRQMLHQLVQHHLLGGSGLIFKRLRKGQ